MPRDMNSISRTQNKGGKRTDSTKLVWNLHTYAMACVLPPHILGTHIHTHKFLKIEKKKEKYLWDNVNA